MTAPFCGCRCHSEHTADRAEAHMQGRFMMSYHHAQAAKLYAFVEASDAVESVTACPSCLDAHCGALSGPVGPVRWPEMKRLNTTPPPNPLLLPWLSQGDGEGQE